MSLGDFWDNQVPGEWRTEGLKYTIRQCRNLDWLILTKRPQNIRTPLPAGLGAAGMVRRSREAPLSKIWLRHGCALLPLSPVPAAVVIWLSVAPLLEPLDLRPWLGRGVDWIRCRWRDWRQGCSVHGTGLGA